MRPDQPLLVHAHAKPGPVGGPGFLASRARSGPPAPRRRTTLRIVGIAILLGAVGGVLVLHPTTMAVYWFEFHPELAGITSVWEFLLFRLRAGFTAPMLAMSAVFAGMGAMLGAVIGFGLAALAWSERRIARLERELSHTLPVLLAAGESEALEFKSSVRWDREARRVNRALEEPVVRTIAGFMNQDGGTLLLGVNDAAQVVGLAEDYATLRRPTRDGFEQFLLTLVRTNLGTHCCPLVHVVFHQIEGRDVCRIVVESAPEPVFIERDGMAQYYVRTGNATRALDPRETLIHTQRRQAPR